MGARYALLLTDRPTNMSVRLLTLTFILRCCTKITGSRRQESTPVSSLPVTIWVDHIENLTARRKAEIRVNVQMSGGAGVGRRFSLSLASITLIRHDSPFPRL